MTYVLEEKLQNKEKATSKTKTPTQKKPPSSKQQNPDFLTKAGSKMHTFNFVNLYVPKVHVL